MTLKDKLIMIFLGIITFGLYPAIVFLRRPIVENKGLEISKNVTADIKKLVLALGGQENIAGTEFTHTKVKIFIKDRRIVDLKNIEIIKGISGVFITSKYVTIIVGNQASKLATLI